MRGVQATQYQAAIESDIVPLMAQVSDGCTAGAASFYRWVSFHTSLIEKRRRGRRLGISCGHRLTALVTSRTMFNTLLDKLVEHSRSSLAYRSSNLRVSEYTSIAFVLYTNVCSRSHLCQQPIFCINNFAFIHRATRQSERCESMVHIDAAPLRYLLRHGLGSPVLFALMM